MSRLKRWRTAVAVLSTLGLLIVAPARGSVSGTFAIACTTTLPAFPGSGSFVCSGSGAGALAGIGSAQSTLPMDTYAHAGATPHAFTASYTAPCVGVAPLIWFATAFMNSPGLGQVNVGDPGPAQFAVPVSWVFVGTFGVAVTGGATGSNGASSAFPGGAGVAAVVPLLGPANLVCPTGGPITLAIAADIVLPA